MKSVILLIVGIIMVAVGILVYSVVGKAFSDAAIEGAPVDLSGYEDMFRYGVGGVVGGIGAIFVLCGLIGLARGSKQAKQDRYIMQTGTDAEGTVTFADKNYSLLVNNRPIYSIVEYTYQDSSGNEYRNRIENLNSDLVIRNQIQVGAKIAIKYAVENPGKSTIVM